MPVDDHSHPFSSLRPAADVGVSGLPQAMKGSGFRLELYFQNASFFVPGGDFFQEKFCPKIWDSIFRPLKDWDRIFLAILRIVEFYLHKHSNF